jgi:hypothetical protein
VKAGSTALLRLVPTKRVYSTLLVFLVLAVVAPVAAAATPAPDPSPLGASAGPDPFPAVNGRPSPSPPPAPAPHTTFHVTPVTVIRPVTAAPAIVRVTPTVKQRARTSVAHVKRSHPARVEHKPARSALYTAALRRIFEDPVQAIPLVAYAVDHPSRVSRTLAIALGLLVLLSASLVGVAAREMAQ